MGVEIHLNNFTRTCYDSKRLCNVTETENSSNDSGEVKHSLKSKILARRKILGLDNIIVDFTPKKLYPMTENEVEKDRRRKESNRNSAQRCRQKQKDEHAQNKQLLEQLREEHENLLDKVKQTEDKKNDILFSLRKILPEAYIHEALRQATQETSQTTAKASHPVSGNLHQSNHVGNDQTESAKASVRLVTREDEFAEDRTLSLEGNFDGGEILFASLLDVSGDIGSMEECGVESLEIGNEVTLGLFDNGVVSDNVESTDMPEQEHVLNSEQNLHGANSTFLTEGLLTVSS